MSSFAPPRLRHRSNSRLHHWEPIRRGHVFRAFIVLVIALVGFGIVLYRASNAQFRSARPYKHSEEQTSQRGFESGGAFSRKDAECARAIGRRWQSRHEPPTCSASAVSGRWIRVDILHSAFPVGVPASWIPFELHLGSLTPAGLARSCYGSINYAERGTSDP